MNYIFEWLNDGEPIENPIWNLSGFTGVEYIDNVSQDGFISSIILTDIYGDRFGVQLVSPTVRPEVLDKPSLITWVVNELIQYEE